MSKALLVIAVASVIAAGTALLIFSGDKRLAKSVTAAPTSDNSGSYTSPSVRSGTAELVTKSDTQNAPVTGPNAAVTWAMRLGFADENRSAMSLAPDLAEPRVVELLAAARAGDGNASFSLFRLAQACGFIDSGGVLVRVPEVRGNTCSSLSLDRTDAREWLTEAASRGVPDAMSTLLGIARGMARSQPLNPESVQFASASIQALQSAAKRGQPEAFRLLWATYSDGLIAPRNPALAYAYLDAFRQGTGDLAASREAHHLSTQLRQGDRLVVEATQRELAEAIDSYRKLSRPR